MNNTPGLVRIRGVIYLPSNSASHHPPARSFSLFSHTTGESTQHTTIEATKRPCVPPMTLDRPCNPPHGEPLSHVRCVVRSRGGDMQHGVQGGARLSLG